MNDALNLAKLFVDKKYRVFYFMDSTPAEYLRWTDWLIENVELELVSYFSGHGTQIEDKKTKDKNDMTEILAFYNANSKLKKSG